MSATSKVSRRRYPFSCRVQLSSNLEDGSVLCPMETTFAEIGLYGSVVLYRFTSGELAEHFELSSAEVDALVAANRKRRSLAKRSLSMELADLELPF